MIDFPRTHSPAPGGPIRIGLQEDGDLLRLLTRARIGDLWHAVFHGGGIGQYATRIETARLLLRPYRPSDYREWAALRRLSRAHLQPWEPLWPGDDLQPAGYRRRLRRDGEDWHQGRAYGFLIFLRQDRRLIGGIGLSNVRRGVSQSGTIGYWIGEPFTRNRLMTEAVGGLTRYAFDVLNLHRLEAVCLPHNAPSRRVLEANGFQHEGTVRSYLKINGRWQDHFLFALIQGR